MEIKDRQICWRKSDEELSKPTDIDRLAAGVTWANESERFATIYAQGRPIGFPDHKGNRDLRRQ
jgi:hypothetical protein